MLAESAEVKAVVERFLSFCHFWGGFPGPQPVLKVPFLITKIVRIFTLASMGHFWGTFGHLESLWSLRGWIWEPPGSILEPPGLILEPPGPDFGPHFA